MAPPTTGDVVKCAFIGLVAWAVTVAACRSAGPIVLAAKHLRVLLFLFSAPLSVAAARLGQVVGGAGDDAGRRVAVTAVQAGTVLCLHGVAAAFLPRVVYHQSTELVASIVSWQMFAAGAAVLGTAAGFGAPTATATVAGGAAPEVL